MSDELNVPAEPVAPETVVAEPNPISTDNVDHEAVAKAEADKATPKPPEPEPKKLTAREAIEKAANTVDSKERAGDAPRDDKGKFQSSKPAEPGAEAKAAEPAKTPEAGATQQQAPATTEPPKAKQPHDDPPARFSPEAKAAWQTVPEHARAETHRAIRELETGIEEHRKRFEPIREYDEMAKQHGTDLKSALDRYVSFDRLLNESPIEGIESILRDKGLPPLREIAAHVLGQKVEPATAEAQTIRRLETTIAQLQQQVGQIGGSIKQQTAQTIEQQVAAFAADKEDFDALSDKVAEHIRAGKPLEEAYSQAKTDAQELAKRLGFIPAATVPTPATVDLIAQTDRGQKSIAGAPGAGSAPAARKASSSVADSVKRAFQAAG